MRRAGLGKEGAEVRSSGTLEPAVLGAGTREEVGPLLSLESGPESGMYAWGRWRRCHVETHRLSQILGVSLSVGQSQIWMAGLESAVEDLGWSMYRCQPSRRVF